MRYLRFPVCLCGALLLPIVANAEGILSGGAGKAILFGQSQGAGRGGAANGAEGGSSVGSSVADRFGAASAGSATTGLAARIEAAFAQARGLCTAVPREYRLDCMLVFFRQALAETPQAGQMAEAHAILRDTVQRLEKLVADNVDASRPTIRAQVREGNRTRATPRLRAVRAERVAQTNAAAARIIAEAETQLLRSAPASSPARLEYTRIASAVGSNKVLLRST